jgi:hypothetical protein
MVRSIGIFIIDNILADEGEDENSTPYDSLMFTIVYNETQKKKVF